MDDLCGNICCLHVLLESVACTEGKGETKCGGANI